MRYIPIILISATISLAACSEAPKTSEGPAITAPVTGPQSALNEKGTQALMNVVTTYYQLKDAFVASDATAADSAVKKLIVATDSMNSALKTDTVQYAATHVYIDSMLLQSNNLLAMKAGDVDAKRAPFEKISDQVYGLIKKVSLKNAGIYREFCPMAFNDKGAFWLSNIAEIKNPYFGKKMLECGEVTDSLK
jgi:Protein of unknown function (DUF3347)